MSAAPANEGERPSFPDDFIWGASFAAHQVEGANFNSDWWRWEQRPGRIAGGATSQTAGNHFTHFREDFELAQKLGLKYLLFSLEWSRIEPRPGDFDDDAIEHYTEVFEALAKCRIQPICALQWNTLPQWFADQGGWSATQAPELFTRYAQHAAAVWGPSCRWWIPIYEPMHQISMGYLRREWPPGKRNPLVALRAIRNLALAHIGAYNALHDARSDILAGPSLRFRKFEPHDIHSPWDLRIARQESGRCGHAFLRLLTEGAWGRIKLPSNTNTNCLDFIGVACDALETIRFHPLRPFQLFTSPETPLDHARESLLPDMLVEMGRYERPLLVTGAGGYAKDDQERCALLLQQLEILQAPPPGASPVAGYIHRSFLDGFEWDQGYSQRHGLVHIDRATLAHTPNNSAYLFKDICEMGRLRPGIIERLCPS